MPLRFPPNKHPGPDAVYVICDVCGRKVRRQDTQLIRDKWNFQNGLVVCNNDVDNVNLQVLPYKHKEKLVTNPETLRSEPTDTFATPDTDDRTPSAPQNLQAQAAGLGSSIELLWQGPEDAGTSRITGYVVQVQNPQLGAWATLESDTGTNATYYNDTTTSLSAEIAYRVAAINGAGTGAYSEPAYYPRLTAPSSYVYLGINGGAGTLGTSDGDLLLSPDV